MSIEVKQAIARAELQRNLTSAQVTIDKMMAQLRREGVAAATIKECLSACGAQLEHDVRRMDSQLAPDSGTTQAKAIPVTHPLQEILLLNEIGAEPLCYKRVKGDNDRYYDEYTVLHQTVSGGRAETSIWFDITESYEKFVKLTKRRAQTFATGSGVCFSCGEVKTRAAMPRCKGCGMATYCNKACQRKHWRGDHKSICKGIQAEKIKLQARIAHMEIEETEQLFKKRAKQPEVTTQAIAAPFVQLPAQESAVTIPMEL